MSIPDKSIDPRLLSAAREEFLKNGFEKSSLAVICKRAGVTTGALYNRFSGKEDLFSALVTDTIRDMEEYVLKIESVDLTSCTDQQIYDAFFMSSEINRQWLEFLYEHKEGLTLLIRSSAGTRYGSFHHDWVKIMSRFDNKYYQEAYRRGLTTKLVSEEELHVLTYGVWGLFYEPFFYDFAWEQIERHAEIIQDFVDWHKALGIKNPSVD